MQQQTLAARGGGERAASRFPIAQSAKEHIGKDNALWTVKLPHGATAQSAEPSWIQCCHASPVTGIGGSINGGQCFDP